MGVINLGTLVDKIRKKLAGDYISKTDVATASAAGIVKVGSNIDVTSDGTISVTFPASSGFTVDVLWTGNLTSDFVDITASLTHPITDYKFLICSRVSGVNVDPGNLLYVPNMSSGGSNQNVMYLGYNTPVTIRLGDGTVSIKSSSSVSGVTLLGIK